MTDDDGAINAEFVKQVAQYRRLRRRRTALTGLARTEAEAGTIDEDDSMVAGGKAFAEREIHVLEIGAGAVQEDDGRTACGGVIAEFDHVLTKTVDLDEAPARQIGPVDQTCANECGDGAGAQDDGHNNERGHSVRTIQKAMKLLRGARARTPTL